MTTRPITIFAALTIAACTTPIALAQPAITIDVENPTLRPGESTTVTMYAGFDARDHAMAGLLTDFVSSIGSAGWSDAQIVSPMDGPGTTAGFPSATGYDEVIAGQLNFAGAGIFADPTNPIAFWRATYMAPTDVAAAFDIDLATMTTRYDVYVEELSSLSESRLADLTEGSATIHVIPAPASASLLAMGLFALRRRRGQASSTSGG